MAGVGEGFEPPRLTPPPTGLPPGVGPEPPPVPIGETPIPIEGPPPSLLEAPGPWYAEFPLLGWIPFILTAFTGDSPIGPGPTGPIRSPNWQPRNILNEYCSNGCEENAKQIQKQIGGTIIKIVPLDPEETPRLGGYRGKNWGWYWHKVVVNDGRVYDAFTGGEGATIDEYKSLWEYPDVIDFGF